MPDSDAAITSDCNKKMKNQLKGMCLHQDPRALQLQTLPQKRGMKV